MGQAAVNRLVMILADVDYDGDFETARFELALRWESKARYAKVRHMASWELWDELGMKALKATCPLGVEGQG